MERGEDRAVDIAALRRRDMKIHYGLLQDFTTARELQTQNAVLTFKVQIIKSHVQSSEYSHLILAQVLMLIIKPTDH